MKIRLRERYEAGVKPSMGEILVARGEAPGKMIRATARPRSNDGKRVGYFSDGMEIDLEQEVIKDWEKEYKSIR